MGSESAKCSPLCLKNTLTRRLIHLDGRAQPWVSNQIWSIKTQISCHTPRVVSHSLFPVSRMCVTVTLEQVGSSSPQYHPHPLLIWINSSSFTPFLFFLQHQLLWQQLQHQTDDLVAQRHAISRPLGHEQGSARLQVELRQPRKGREFSMYLKYSEETTVSDQNNEMFIPVGVWSLTPCWSSEWRLASRSKKYSTPSRTLEKHESGLSYLLPHIVFFFKNLIVTSIGSTNSELHVAVLTSRGVHSSEPDSEGQRGQVEPRAGGSAIGWATVRLETRKESQPVWILR